MCFRFSRNDLYKKKMKWQHLLSFENVKKYSSQPSVGTCDKMVAEKHMKM